MSTIDSNGILFYESTDIVAPLETALNTGQTSVTNAITSMKTKYDNVPNIRFQGSLGAGVSVAGSTNIPFTANEDTVSGWSTGTNAWTSPRVGTFLLLGSVKNAATPTAMSIKFLKNGTQVYVSPTPASIAYGGISTSFYVRLAVGDTLSMQTTVGYITHTDAPAVDNVFQIVQVQV